MQRSFKDSLPTLISKSPECFQEVSKIIQRQLLEQLDKRGEVIAKAFLSNDAKQTLIDEVIEYKTGDSLQSSQQVQQICKFFGISQPSKEKMSDLDKAFKARNQIIHRLDEDPAHPKRKRKQRKMDELKNFTETTFFIVSHIIQKVDTNLSSSQIESKIESQALEKLSEKGD